MTLGIPSPVQRGRAREGARQAAGSDTNATQFVDNNPWRLSNCLGGGESIAPTLTLPRFETVDFLRDSPSRRRRTTAAPQGERRKSFEINTNTARAEAAALLSGRLEAPSAH
jgi:hypothetical protein